MNISRQMMKYNIQIFLGLLLFLIYVTQICLAEDSPRYIWNKRLNQLPVQQREFVEDIVEAFRNADMDLGRHRLHSEVLKYFECSNRFLKIFKMSTIKEQYAVKVKPGKTPDSLHFSIRHQQKGEDSKRSFMKFKNVVEENGRLVIYIKSCVET